jgi:hypothetical protein
VAESTRYVFRHSKNFELEDKKSLRSVVPAIPMMKTAESRIRSHCCRRPRPALHRPSPRRVFIEGIVNPIVVVIVDIVAHQPPQMSFVQRDHVVQDLPATTSDPSLRDPVLPRRLNTRALRRKSCRFQEADYVGIESRIVVQDDIPIRTCLGKTPPAVAGRPNRRWDGE